MAIASVKNWTYKTRLLGNFTILFIVFSVVLVLFQHQREQSHREDLIKVNLRACSEMIAERLIYLDSQGDSLSTASLVKYMPKDLRLTVVNRAGQVLCETEASPNIYSQNHRTRPEVAEAFLRGESTQQRTSESTGTQYIYFAKAYDDFVVRVALPCNDSLQLLFQPDNLFLWFVILIFPILLVMLTYMSDRLGKSVKLLRRFISEADRGMIDYKHFRFPRSELGDVGQALLEKYKQLEISKQMLEDEHERLIRHFHYFEDGIAIFSPERVKQYANPRFLQYVNQILDEPTADVHQIWNHATFAPVLEFLKLHTTGHSSTEEAPIFRFTIPAGSSYLALQVLVFNDDSFEMTLSDITRAEKARRLKQQMSNNITHELRTPVSSIRGYIETILNCQNLSEERKAYYLGRAHAQVLRLTDLIRDVSLITKTEEAPETMEREMLSPKSIVEDIIEELRPALIEAKISVESYVTSDIRILGNYTLIYSIFRNLVENSLRYAGSGSIIRIECYNVDETYCYFRYYDTGCGVAEEHLPRLFERFYRVSEGRTREGVGKSHDEGGTGLGLSIVRNAVQFHGGTISVRNRAGEGLEFLFTLLRQYSEKSQNS